MLTQEMVDFWIAIGAEAQEIGEQYYTMRGGHKQAKHYRIRMGNGDWSHKLNDGSDNYLIHMREEFAPEASVFIIKYLDNIINHDIKVPKNDYEKQNH